MARLFDRIPGELFSPLARKYKAIYAFALVCLYHCIKLYKTDIKRSDFASLLRSQGEELMALFNIETDKLDDKDESEEVAVDDSDTELNQKVSYIIRKLASCGWFIISKDPKKNNVEYIYIPAYSIQLLKIIDEITSDVGSYLPLVHQTYAELKMEDEKEDDYIYRSLMNARTNADTIEMSVTLLRQQICVFGNRLTSVLDPNVALKQHFDEYRLSISDKYYHPMKTFDSLGLYSLPTITILNRWLKSERIISLLVKEAKAEPMNQKKEEATLASEIIKIIQEIIDIFSRLTTAFNDIDVANANYTEAVQRKINYLSASDKTTKGKIDAIILSMANEIKNNPALRYEEMPILNRAHETLILNRQGFFDSQSLTMPFKRNQVEEGEFLPLDDEFYPEEQSALMDEFMNRQLTRFSDSAILDFLSSHMEGKDELVNTDVDLTVLDNLVLWILAVIKANLGVIPYEATKISDRIEYANYYMPLYRFTRKKNGSNGG